MQVISVTTLADLRREGWTIYAHCQRNYCGRGRRLDIDALIEKFGPDHCFIGDTEIGRRLRCTCGHRGGSLRFSPPDKSSSRNHVKNR